MNTTFVTAFYDIKRENWSNYKRTPDDYLSHFEKISNIDANMVIYCQDEYADKINKIRPESKNTKIIVKNFNDLDFYQKFYNKTDRVMKTDYFKQRIIHHDIPEMIYPEYNIINFNKISFVKESLDIFDSEIYGWIDFGYGGGKVKISYDENNVRSYIKNDKIYMVALKVPPDDLYFSEISFFTNIVYITGSCFITTKNVVSWFYENISSTIDKCLDYNLIDDDQTIYNIVYLNNKNKFNLKISNWFTHFQG